MDLNVYEDDDDETLHRKLIAAKIARKRAEEDMKLLQNRIGLLRAEEQKVCIFIQIHRDKLYYSIISIFRNADHLCFNIGMEEDRRDQEESQRHNVIALAKYGDSVEEDGETEAEGRGGTDTHCPKQGYQRSTQKQHRTIEEGIRG